MSQECVSQDATVSAVRKAILAADSTAFEQLVRAYAADPRKGVQHALGMRCRQLEREHAEIRRIDALYAFDASYNGVVVGLDEVGRGALAGPLAVGAVVLPSWPHLADLNDSKQLTAAQREAVAREIKQHALAYEVYFVAPKTIDECGMAAALRLAFRGALSLVEQAGIIADVVLIDGNPLHLDTREVNVIKGDATSACIAAASIYAKVARDAYMKEQDPLFPQYGFSSNKGYGSAQHIDAIFAYGLSSLHRASFCRSYNQERLF